MCPGFDSRLMPPSFFSNVVLLFQCGLPYFIVKLRRHGDSNPCAQSAILATRTHHVFAVLDSHQNVVLRSCGSLFISNFSVLRPTLFWVVICFVPSVALICIWARLPGSRSEFLLLRRVFVGSLYMFHCEFWRWLELLGILAEIPKSQHALRTKRTELSFSPMEYSWMFLHDMDTLAEWSRRQPAKPMGSPRVGSNPTGVDFLLSMLAGVSVRGQEDRQRGLEAVRSFQQSSFFMTVGQGWSF